MDELLRQLTQQVQNKYYGKYRGFVSDNSDPDQVGRLKVTVPSVLGDTVTGWALPCLPFGGLADQGLFTIPEVGAQVWVEFEEGELSHPIWVGTFWQNSGDAPTEGAVTPPTTRVLKTPSGHVLQFDDASGSEQFRLHHPAGSEMTIDPQGSIAVTDANGATVTLDVAGNQVIVQDANGNSLTMTTTGTTVQDSNGNTIEMGPGGVKVKASATVTVEGALVTLGGQGGEPVIKGTSFLTLFATHMHPTAMGPSGPPVPQGEMSSLSTKVMTS
jgi:uncharacterized protein involved in type VI secretion and phage assembly